MTPEDIADALREAYSLGLSDGHPLSRHQGRRQLETLIAETLAALQADLSPALGG